MKQSEYSPPSSPTIHQQRDALQKGLGRAVQWALSCRLSEGALLAACLRDGRYDTELEEPRGEWLWDMVRAMGAVERFRVPVLHALHALDDEKSAGQIVDLAQRYAEAGDEAVHTRFYEIVEARPYPRKSWLGENNLVYLDGGQGFRFAARIRGKELAREEWDWEHGSFAEYAVERLGEAGAIAALEDTDDPDLIRFRECWRSQREQEEAARDDRNSHREEMRAISVTQILSAAESDKDRLIRFSSWGIYADAADLEAIIEHLWAATDPCIIANLIRIFFHIPLPRLDSRWFDLCRHPDRDVRVGAFNALENNRHPLVREFALAELDATPFPSSVVGLFIKNYQKGDEAKILEAIELPDDTFALHSLLMDIIKVLENNEDADCLPLALPTYVLTPCENCRRRAVKLLLRQRVAPDWLIEECRLDACPDIRREILAHAMDREDCPPGTASSPE